MKILKALKWIALVIIIAFLILLAFIPDGGGKNRSKMTSPPTEIGK